MWQILELNVTFFWPKYKKIGVEFYLFLIKNVTKIGVECNIYNFGYIPIADQNVSEIGVGSYIFLYQNVTKIGARLYKFHSSKCAF